VQDTASRRRCSSTTVARSLGVLLLWVVVSPALGCSNGQPAGPTRLPVFLAADPVPPGVAVSISAVDLGGRNVLATANLQGAAAVQFEWYFERGPVPEVVTGASQAGYVYELPGFKDFTVRITLADGRRILGSGAVVVE
jgi:hypothetical protein